MNQDKTLLVTTPSVDGKHIVRVSGLVQGNRVRARNNGKDFLAVLRNVLGGEMGQYSRLLTESREQAMSRMVPQAEELGVNAVVHLRFATSMILSGTAEIPVYGTAVVLED